MFLDPRLAQQATSHLRLATELFEDHFEPAQHKCPLLSARELATYDLGKMFRGMLDPMKRDEAAFEFGVDMRAVKRGLASGRGTFVPWSVLTRDFNVSSSTQAGPLVSTDKSRDVGGWLRPVSACIAAGASVIAGLDGTGILPYVSTGASATMITEASPASESTPVVSGLTLTPRTITGYVDFSRQYDVQNPDLVNVLASDLRAAVGAVIDDKVLNGTGTNEPLGVINHTGIGSYALGTNGGYLTWLDITKLEQVVEEANGMLGAGAHVTSPKIKRGLRQYGASGESPVWQRVQGVDFLGGTPAWASTHVPTNLAKGTSSDCSPLIYGYWPELFIGLWGGGLEFIIDRVTMAGVGLCRMTVFLAMDAGIRRAGCFAAVKDSRIPA